MGSSISVNWGPLALILTKELKGLFSEIGIIFKVYFEPSNLSGIMDIS